MQQYATTCIDKQQHATAGNTMQQHANACEIMQHLANTMQTTCGQHTNIMWTACKQAMQTKPANNTCKSMPTHAHSCNTMHKRATTCNGMIQHANTNSNTLSVNRVGPIQSGSAIK